jgi:hypothetical protein
MDRFIVGTGRCGSTLLSRMLAENPSLLMIFEFFSGLDIAGRFGPEPLDGGAFAALIAQETPAVTMAQRRGYEIAEITYPYGPGMRYRRGEGLPWIVGTALARMSDDPDSLFDETLAFASDLPQQHLSAHYRQLFDWLTERFDRRCWIEKSGSSIEYLGTLADFYPKARFLHLHRDGPEAALSMREHHIYRLWVSLLFESEDDLGSSNQELAGLDSTSQPEEGDPIAKRLESKPPVELFGRYWTELVSRGFRALGRLDADQYLEIRFEDLVSDPKETLPRIAEFLELDGGQNDWVDRAAGLVKGIPPTRFEALSDREQRSLSEACRPGQQLLGRVD